MRIIASIARMLSIFFLVYYGLSLAIVWMISGQFPLDGILEGKSDWPSLFIFLLIFALSHNYLSKQSHAYISPDDWHKMVQELHKETPILNEQSVEYDDAVARVYESLITTESGKPLYSVDPKIAWQNLLSVSKKLSKKNHS